MEVIEKQKELLNDELRAGLNQNHEKRLLEIEAGLLTLIQDRNLLDDRIADLDRERDAIHAEQRQTKLEDEIRRGVKFRCKECGIAVSSRLAHLSEAGGWDCSHSYPSCY